jgi:hypothetical protein
VRHVCNDVTLDVMCGAVAHSATHVLALELMANTAYMLASTITHASIFTLNHTLYVAVLCIHPLFDLIGRCLRCLLDGWMDGAMGESVRVRALDAALRVMRQNTHITSHIPPQYIDRLCVCASATTSKDAAYRVCLCVYIWIYVSMYIRMYVCLSFSLITSPCIRRCVCFTHTYSTVGMWATCAHTMPCMRSPRPPTCV